MKNTIYDDIIDYFAKNPTELIVDNQTNFGKMMEEIYGKDQYGNYIKGKSWQYYKMLPDLCYNKFSTEWTKRPRLFEKLEQRGYYKFLGLNAKYSGIITNKDGIPVGEWVDGRLIKDPVEYKNKNNFQNDELKQQIRKNFCYQFIQSKLKEISKNNIYNKNSYTNEGDIKECVMTNLVEDQVMAKAIDDEDDNVDLNLKTAEATIRSERKDMDISSLHMKYKKGKLIIQPEYQRNYVWDKKKASNLIESLILKIPVPPIFVAEENGTYEIIDGQQRLTSIFNFIDNVFVDKNTKEIKEFKLNHLQILTELSGKNFNNLPDDVQEKIIDSSLSVIIIKSETNKDVKFEMFNRLNTNITKLSNQELRNCLYRGEYNEFIKKMAQYEPFRKLINKPALETRMGYEELVLSFLTFIDTDYHQYKGGLKLMMNNNMEKNKNISEEDLKLKEIKFKKSTDIVKMMFKDGEAFRVFSYSEKDKSYRFDTQKINQGLYLILMYWFSMYEKHQVVPYLDTLRETLLNLQTSNDEFINSITGSGTNTTVQTLKKFNIWGQAVQNIIGQPYRDPRAFTYELKEELFNKNPICAICGNKIYNIDDAEVDHINCFSKGGLTIPENAQLTHRFCNRYKSNHS